MPIPLTERADYYMFTAIPGARVVVAQEPQMVVVERQQTLQEAAQRSAAMIPQPAKSEGLVQSLSKTWGEPGLKPEFILSELAFRRLWDPGYKARYESEYAAWRQSLGGPSGEATIRRQQAAQVETAVSVGLITVTAVSLARSAYTIAKGYWPQSKEAQIVEKALTVTAPEVTEAPLTVTRVSGPGRLPETVTITPQEKALAEGFNITWTRGTSTTPMKTTLDRLLKDTRGSMLVPELILAKPLPQTVHVPSFIVSPWQITQFSLAGMAAGRLFAPREAARIPSLIPSAVSVQAPRAQSVQRLSLGLVNVQTPRISMIEDQRQALEQTQQSQQAQIQEQKQALQQRSLMEVPNQLRPYDPFDFTRRRRGRKQQIPGDFYTRYRRINPISEGRRALRIMFGV